MNRGVGKVQRRIEADDQDAVQLLRVGVLLHVPVNDNSGFRLVWPP